MGSTAGRFAWSHPGRKSGGVGGKSAGPFVGNVIPDEDHLGRIGRRLQTEIVGSQLSVGDERHQGGEQHANVFMDAPGAA